MIRRLVSDLSLPVEVVGCPIVRDADGLALSSRNVYLSPEQRAAAPVLHRALQAGAARAAHPGAHADAVRQAMVDVVAAEPAASLDYADLVAADSLEPAVVVGGPQRLLIAARFGATRLLDNLGTDPSTW